MNEIAASQTLVREPKIRCLCGKCASLFLEIHAVDQCYREPTLGQFFCEECLRMHVETAQFIADAGTETCEICNKRLSRLCDIIIRVCRILA